MALTTRELLEAEWLRPGCRCPWHRTGWYLISAPWVPGYSGWITHDLMYRRGQRYPAVRRHYIRWPWRGIPLRAAIDSE